MEPTLIQGACFKDDRGILKYNNDFNALGIKRMYLIQNSESNPVRGWRGHRIEQRWFIAVNGSFDIFTIAIDNWEHPSQNLAPQKFQLKHGKLDVLHVPPGHITAIRSLMPGSVLLVMSDYLLGAIQDEYRFALDYFKNNVL